MRYRYVTVDRKAGRALYYTFAESRRHSARHPLVLWLNGCAFVFDGVFA